MKISSAKSIGLFALLKGIVVKSNVYSRLTIADRNAIEKFVDVRDPNRKSARTLASELGRSPSTITRELKNNRTFSSGKRKGQQLSNEDLLKIECPRLCNWPYVCNGCIKRHYGCSYFPKCEYRASYAHQIYENTLKESRKGVNMTPNQLESVLETIRIDIQKGLSPYQISIGRSDELSLSVSTIYRWVSRGYGGMSNFDLRRKVKYKKRKEHHDKKPTAHGKSRSYEAFLDLPIDMQQSAWEMDTVEGMKTDTKRILTIYHRPSKFQLTLLLSSKTVTNVVKYFDVFETTLGKAEFSKLFTIILTDNGVEFSDYKSLEKSIQTGKRNKIYYCDVRESQQKGACEKNHVEVRKILPKRQKISFDLLDNFDMSQLMSHLNSQPRESLGGKTPIQMFKFITGSTGEKISDLLGIEEVNFDDLDLRPEMINKERQLRGLLPIK
ncbi:MAG: IS30 family transposase [Eggerthellaceae bacterium]|nr:IS30 family transposase [Eggerthellaceae bacterium]